MIKSNAQVALDFVRNPDREFTAVFNREPCSANMAAHVLENGKVNENGLHLGAGNDGYWFNGMLEGKAFVLGILGDGVGALLWNRITEESKSGTEDGMSKKKTKTAVVKGKDGAASAPATNDVVQLVKDQHELVKHIQHHNDHTRDVMSRAEDFINSQDDADEDSGEADGEADESKEIKET